jgi:hypothetical protein
MFHNKKKKKKKLLFFLVLVGSFNFVLHEQSNFFLTSRILSCSNVNSIGLLLDFCCLLVNIYVLPCFLIAVGGR